MSFPDKQEGEFVFTGRVLSLDPFRCGYGSDVSFTVPGGVVKEMHGIRRAGLGTQAYDMLTPPHYGTFGGWPVKVVWCLGRFTPGI